jgi:hypothetical protein
MLYYNIVLHMKSTPLLILFQERQLYLPMVKGRDVLLMSSSPSKI